MLGTLLLVALATLFGGRPAGAQDEGGDEPTGRIRGTLQIEVDGEDEPVEDAELTVTLDDEEVATATTDADGRWEAEVPPGRGYAVTLETDSLPDGVSLRGNARETLSNLAVGPSLPRVVSFPLGEREAGESLASRLGKGVASGFSVGLIIGVAAIGLSLIFGVTGLVNFAHGELVTFGALVAYFFSSGTVRLPLVLAGVVTALVGAGLGWGLERGLFGPLRSRGTGNVALIVGTIGLSLFARHVYVLVFDRNPRPYRQYAVQQAVFAGLTPKDFVIMAVAIVVMVGVGLLLQLTRVGTAIRAVADNPDLAESSGIDVRRIITVVWAAGTGLAAIGGTLYAVDRGAQWDMGYQLLLLMFAAVVLGGLGSAYGAMVGGLIVGLVAEVSTVWIPVDFKYAVALGVLIVVLIFRPQGVLGVRERLG